MPENVQCPTCAQPAHPDDVALEKGIVRCRACDRVYRLLARRVKPRVAARPDRWSVAEDGAGGLRLTYRWRGVELFFFLAWTAVWWGGLADAWAAGGGPFLVPHALAGLAVVYWTACIALNTTAIRAGRGRLTVSHGPLWWPGATELAARDVEQLFVEERTYKHRRSWRVCAVDRSGIAHAIGGAHHALASARWLEQTLEDHLGIDDRRHPGEA